MHELLETIYLFPSTDPSFFPSGSSSSTPAQTPGANSVTPTYRKVPALLPRLLDTITRSPKRRSPFVVVEIEASKKIIHYRANI